MKRLFLLMPMLIMLLLLSCSPSPKEIDYGNDICHFCKMTIVDKQHAAQLVSNKGKVTSYDAIECMINYIDSHSDLSVAFSLVNDYSRPSVLMDAASSYYLVSKAIPSPMGAFLSAFSTKEEALKIQVQKGGHIYDWPEIRRYISADSTTGNSQLGEIVR